MPHPSPQHCGSAFFFCIFGGAFGIALIVLDRRHCEFSELHGRETSVAVKKVTLGDIGKLPARLWVLSCIISLYYIGIFAFIAVAKDFFEGKWNSDSTVRDGASFRSSVVYLMSMIFTIFVGAFVDSVGRRAWIMTVTCFMSMPAFLLFEFTMLDPMWGMLLLGCTYMFAASSMWPCIPLVVPMELVGTANGIATSLQMIGIALANMLVGILQDAGPGYYPGTSVKSYSYCMIFFMASGLVATLLSLVLNYLDAQSGGILNRRPEPAQTQVANTQSLQPVPSERRPDGPGDL